MKATVPLAILLTLSFSCSDDDKTDASTQSDASTGNDAGTSQDGGTQQDAGTGNTDCISNLGASACGGDLVGSWTYHSACVEPGSIEIPSCPAAVPSNEAAVASGTLTLNSDNTYTRVANTTATMDIAVPASCAMPAGGCTAVEVALEALANGLTADCTDDGSQGCDCDVALDVRRNDSGNYTVAGNIATVDGTDLYYFCAENNVLKYKGTANNPTDNVVSYVATK